MTEKESALFSHYIIDGVRFDSTPAELLSECSGLEEECKGVFDDIVDELYDHPVTSFTYDNAKNSEYIRVCIEHMRGCQGRSFRMLYPETFTKQRIAYALIHTLWLSGHYRLGDLQLWAAWNWNTRPLGNMGAFYMSAEAASAYMFDLGVKLQEFTFCEQDDASRVDFSAWIPDNEGGSNDDDNEENIFKVSPYESSHPWISEDYKCNTELVDCESDSVIIYIPFDTCRFSLGGSLLAQLYGHNGGTPPHIQDPDYFIDCWEVVREFVEDGIIMAGCTVGDGGLATAAAMMCGIHGMELDINGLLSSYQETDSTKILFGEVPGVLLQVKANDIDYIDSQLLLQDVAYYFIGRPKVGLEGLRLINENKTEVAGILAALLEQASEGED